MWLMILMLSVSRVDLPAGAYVSDDTDERDDQPQDLSGWMEEMDEQYDALRDACSEAEGVPEEADVRLERMQQCSVACRAEASDRFTEEEQAMWDAFFDQLDTALTAARAACVANDREALDEAVRDLRSVRRAAHREYDV